MDIELTLARLTIEEKAALVSGTNFMYTNPIPRLHIPALCMADGPHGLRRQTGKRDNGVAQSEPATAFPSAVTTASSWNPENAWRMGAAMAAECRRSGVHLLLGPGVNIKRNPLCGRNFEYFSEDPLLAGKMGAAQVQGIQSGGVGVSVKHFALNNSENYRFMGDSVADRRAAHEIYLKPFERIVKEAQPATLMCAYNRINGAYCSENRWLLTDILREDWGFHGAVMTDWGAVRDRVHGLRAGLDLEMPGDTPLCRRQILDGIADGSLSMAELDHAVENILRLVATYASPPPAPAVDFSAHHTLAAEIAADAAVLLENDGTLPLRLGEKLLVVGELFENMRYQGAGSSMIHPTQVTSPRDAFERRNVSFEFVRGYRESESHPDLGLISQATAKAEACETVLIFAGLTDAVESEGCDRETMALPENQLALIDALCKTGKKLVLVLFGGSVVELPFAAQMNAILHMFLPGQNGGTATASLLFGDRSPAGRLAETWPMRYADVPFGREFGKLPQELYRESVYVGYRYYLTAGEAVRYPFGYGLSYTAFHWDNIAVSQKEDCLTVSCEVSNTGSYAAAEVVQLYIKSPSADIFRPERELRGFQKVLLEPGERKAVTISLPLDDLRYYHQAEDRWVLEDGLYLLQLCSDCQTIQLEQPLELHGEQVPLPYLPEVDAAYRGADTSKMTMSAFEALLGYPIPAIPPRLPITIESRFTDLRHSLVGSLLFYAATSVTELPMKLALHQPEGPERNNRIKGARFLRRILESNSLRALSMSAGGALPWNLAQSVVELVNGHPLRCLRCALSPIQVPPLPKAVNRRRSRKSASSQKKQKVLRN